MIRHALVSDAQAIAEVHVLTWAVAYAGIIPSDEIARRNVDLRLQQWQNQLAQSPLIVVAEQDEQVVGFANGGKCRDDIPHIDGELYALYVLPSAQGKGHGANLLRKIGAELAQQSFHNMLIWVLKDNLPARHFYEHMGGTVVAEKIVAFGIDLVEIAYCWQDLSIFVSHKNR